MKREERGGHSRCAEHDASAAGYMVAFCWCVMPRQKRVGLKFKKRYLTETSQISRDLLSGFKACASRKPICADNEARDASMSWIVVDVCATLL